ncbi:hypothetical protein GC197_00205 [bacterium]|nr:hypothetical protein [bacterium]
MGYSQFLEILLSEGRAVVPEMESIREESRVEAARIIAHYEAIWRRDLPRSLPAMNPAAANWAAEKLFRACQFLIYRDADEGAMQSALQGNCPVVPSPESHYSVDLTFRFLPDVEKSARAASGKDPLVDTLRSWAINWPLSSVGMPNLGELNIAGFAGNCGLMQVYADRILATKDQSRLADPRVKQHVLVSVGAYPELAIGLDLGEVSTETGAKQ